jgi:hypothetical protein
MLAGRSGRVEQKVRLAWLLLAELPPADATTRLLRTAVVRRDEVLLDQLLAVLMRRGV